MAISVGDADEDAPMSNINVTPLVDVMLVLLIIFIITIPVLLKQVKLTLPKASNIPTVTKPENITIAVDRQGNVYWNTVEVKDQQSLQDKLRIVARMEPQPEVHIRGDSQSRYMYVGRVLVTAQKIGIHKVGFLTEPEHLGVR
jgi:biopolymer transport protein ExbD